MNIMDKINEFAFDANEVAKVSSKVQTFLSDEQIVEAVRRTYKDRIIPEAVTNHYHCTLGVGSVETWLSSKVSVTDFRKIVDVFVSLGFKVDLYADDTQITIHWKKIAPTLSIEKEAPKRKWYQWK